MQNLDSIFRHFHTMRTLQICGELLTVTENLIEKLPTLRELVADTHEDNEALPVPEITVREFRAVCAHVELGRALKPKYELAAAFLGLEASTAVELPRELPLPHHDDWQLLHSLKVPWDGSRMLDELESATVLVRSVCAFSKSLLWKKVSVPENIRVRLIDIEFQECFEGMSPVLFKKHLQISKPLFDFEFADFPISLDCARFCLEELAEPLPQRIYYKHRAHSFKDSISIMGAGQLRLYFYAESATGNILPPSALPLIRVVKKQTLQTSGIHIAPNFLHDICLPQHKKITLQPQCRFSNVTFYLVIAVPFWDGFAHANYGINST